MTKAQEVAYARYKAAMDEFFLALLGETPVKIVAPARPASGMAEKPQSKPPIAKAGLKPAPPAKPALTLPSPSLPGRGGTVLTDETRAKQLPAATAVALRILKVIGDGPQIVPGVTGQLALDRIPCDALLVQQAIDAARKQV